MKTLPMIRGLFVVAALYDGILGLAFLFAGPALFHRFNIGPPNHWAYVHFPALLLLIFGAAAGTGLIVYLLLVRLTKGAGPAKADDEAQKIIHPEQQPKIGSKG